MRFFNVELNDIQCHLLWLPSQGNNEGNSRMYTRMFAEVSLSEQERNWSPTVAEYDGLVRKEGGVGESKPSRKARPCAGMKLD